MFGLFFEVGKMRKCSVCVQYIFLTRFLRSVIVEEGRCIGGYFNAFLTSVVRNQTCYAQYLLILNQLGYLEIKKDKGTDCTVLTPELDIRPNDR